MLQRRAKLILLIGIPVLILAFTVILLLYFRGIPIPFVEASKSPADVFGESMAAISSGNKEAFMATLSKRSKVFMEAVLSLSPLYQKLTPPFGKPQSYKVVASRVENADTVVLDVKDHRGIHKVVFIQEEGGWHIDLFEMDKYLQRSTPGFY